MELGIGCEWLAAPESAFSHFDCFSRMQQDWIVEARLISHLSFQSAVPPVSASHAALRSEPPDFRRSFRWSGYSKGLTYPAKRRYAQKLMCQSSTAAIQLPFQQCLP